MYFDYLYKQVISDYVSHDLHNKVIERENWNYPSSCGVIMTTTTDNERIYRQINEEIWGKRDLDAIDDLIAEDIVVHDPSMTDMDGPSGRAGYQQMVEMGSDAFKHSTLDLQQIISTDDFVIGRWSMTAKHVGKLGNIHPSDEEVSITGIEICRFEDGMLAESWQEVNFLDMLTKAGELRVDIFAPEMPAADD